MEKNNTIWIVGCGDIGRRVAKLYEGNGHNGHSIYGIVSSVESSDKCKQLSIKTQILDLDSDFALDSVNTSDNDDLNKADNELTAYDLFYFAPPPSTGAKDIRLKRFLAKLSDQLPRRIVMISTTGVYGDSEGAWIDENTAVNPQADRAVRRVSAEQILQRWTAQTNVEFMILRVPGIYATDRLPLARLEKNLPIVKESEAGYTNRIHADDLARACKAAMESTQHNHIINVTDGNPSTMTDYFNRVADYAKLPRPPQINLQEAEQTLSEGMVSYLKESRRIKNDKMLDILGIELLYPSLKDALKG